MVQNQMNLPGGMHIFPTININARLPGGSAVKKKKKKKNPPVKQETQVDPWVVKIPWKGNDDPLQSFLPGLIPCREEPDGLQSIGLQ